MDVVRLAEKVGELLLQLYASTYPIGVQQLAAASGAGWGRALNAGCAGPTNRPRRYLLTSDQKTHRNIRWSPASDRDALCSVRSFL